MIVALTTKDIKNIEPFEVFVEKTKETGIDKSSKLKFNYPQTIDRERLKEHLGVASREVMEKAKEA
ncbi:MAG TPA: type II toxin-antitoxin system PemK/MazF family toxin [Aquella sp.]|nr:type II toxin-antitoxin system PemK/MazF family toxin [Aquella sp.]